MPVNDDLAGLLGSGLVTPEEIAASKGMTGQKAADQGPMVWVPGQKRKGTRTTTSERGGEFYGRGRVINEVVEPEGEQSSAAVRAWVYDPTKRRQIEAYLRKKGFDTTNFQDVENAWFSAVDRAEAAFMGAGMKKSPWDMLDLMSPPEDQTPKPFKGLEWTQTSQRVDMADMPPELIRNSIRETLQDLLGRGPTDEEISDFSARASAIAAENPYTQTATTEMEWDPKGGESGKGGYVERGTTIEESGISEQELGARVEDMAYDQASSSDEGKEFGRVRGINILMDMLSGGG